MNRKGQTSPQKPVLTNEEKGALLTLTTLKVPWLGLIGNLILFIVISVINYYSIFTRGLNLLPSAWQDLAAFIMAAPPTIGLIIIIILIVLAILCIIPFIKAALFVPLKNIFETKPLLSSKLWKTFILMGSIILCVVGLILSGVLLEWGASALSAAGIDTSNLEFLDAITSKVEGTEGQISAIGSMIN